MKKPRSNSVLDNLPSEQKAALTVWLFKDGVTYRDCAARLLAQFNLRCAHSAVADFYKRHVGNPLMNRAAADVVSAAGVTTANEFSPLPPARRKRAIKQRRIAGHTLKDQRQ